jgi:photosystem II stability/assembly factor-like uncharacterized protein
MFLMRRRKYHIARVASILAATTALAMVTAARPTATTRLPETKATVHDVTMVTATMGWGLSATGQVLRTTNDGQSWTSVSAPHPHTNLLATAFTSPQQAVMVGAARDGRQWLTCATSNGGHTWYTTRLSVPQRGQISDATAEVSAYSAQREWLMIPVNMPAKPAQDRLYGTTDGGETWHLINANLPGSDNAGVVFSQSQVGWLPLNTNSVRNLKFLANTTNGGRTWQTMVLSVPPLLAPHASNPKEDYSPNPVGLPVFATPQLGALLTTYGALNANGSQKPEYSVVYFTTDGGRHWQWTVLPTESQNAINPPSTVAWQSTPQGWVLNVRTVAQKIIAQWSIN